MKRTCFFTVMALLMAMLVTRVRNTHAADFLFVQTGTGATLNGTLTMTGVTTKMSFFADRPVRVAGIMTTDEFLTLFEPSATFDEVRIHLPQLCVCACRLRLRLHDVSLFFFDMRRNSFDTHSCVCVCMC